MRAILHWTGILFVIAVTGCGPPPNTALHKAALQLKSGMTRTDVESLFSDFSRSGPEDFEGKLADFLVVEDPPVIYDTNIDRGTQLTYSGDMSGFIPQFENCTVYFNTNNVIVGYRYSYDR